MWIGVFQLKRSFFSPYWAYGLTLRTSCVNRLTRPISPPCASAYTYAGSAGSSNIQKPSPPYMFSQRELLTPPGYDESPTQELLSCSPP